MANGCSSLVLTFNYQGRKSYLSALFSMRPLLQKYNNSPRDMRMTFIRFRGPQALSDNLPNYPITKFSSRAILP
jgi:hypothetical protein